MRRFGLVVLGVMAPVVAQSATLPPPLAQASQGRVECYVPSHSFKSCRSMASYALKADGSITSTSTTLLIHKPVVIMTADSAVTIKDRQVCGYVTLESLGQASFTVDGAPATPEQTAQLRDHLQTGYKPLLGKEICTGYSAAGDAMMTTVTIGGVAQPSQGDLVIWVSPSDGYKVQP
jgi:hypothetical protein